MSKELDRLDSDYTEVQAEMATKAIRDGLEDVKNDIIAAYHGRVWLALGYKTWQHWTDGEFQSIPLDVGRDERKVAVGTLRAAGLSTRAIASAVGVSHHTVARDAAQVSHNETPHSSHESQPQVTGLDGKSYNAVATVIDADVVPDDGSIAHAEDFGPVASVRADKAISRLQGVNDGLTAKLDSFKDAAKASAKADKLVSFLVRAPSDLEDVADVLTAHQMDVVREAAAKILDGLR